MRFFGLSVLAILSACSRGENRFVVEDDQSLVIAANIELCDSVVPMDRTGDRFIGSVAINCEGSGHIKLRYASGDEHDCLIGYVTPGIIQSITYQATAQGCV